MSGQEGWIGVDLDGTLAHYDGWRGKEHIGRPVEAMAERVRRWLGEGKLVKIFTARVSGDFDDPEFSRKLIGDWTLKHLGSRLEVTCKKDYAMLELWDDRAISVELNTGKIIRRGE